MSNGKKVGIGCAGALALIVFGGCMAAVSSDDSSDSKSGAKTADVVPDPTTAAVSPSKTKSATPTKEAAEQTQTTEVVFRVKGTAPAGALGGLDITYGSDSDTRKGTFKNGVFKATLPYNEDAMYYHVSAQLQGSGDIDCSVTVDGKTKNGHASGGYNICDAQLSSGLFGDWS